MKLFVFAASLILCGGAHAQLQPLRIELGIAVNALQFSNSTANTGNGIGVGSGVGCPCLIDEARPR
jgi:hypothetical protein